MMMKLRVAHIGPSALAIRHEFGGAIERRILELARAQARQGHEVAVYSAGDETATEAIGGFHVESIACHTHGVSRRFEFTWKALADLRRKGVDAIHFHSVPHGAVFARGIRAKKLLSYDFFQFTSKANPLFWLYRYALKQFDCLLPVSEYCRKHSIEYWSLAKQQVRVFYNGVNLTQFRPDHQAQIAKRSALGIAADAPVISYVGRVCYQKGTDVLLDAYQSLKERFPSLCLVIAGPADKFGYTSTNDLTERIKSVGGIYLGPVHEVELAGVYNITDIFVMPTRQYEMFGMAAAEAQACGKPVVCTRHGGLIEVVSQESGLFFPVDSSEALADQVAELLLNSQLYRDMSIAARENARRFDWCSLASELERIYSETFVS